MGCGSSAQRSPETEADQDSNDSVPAPAPALAPSQSSAPAPAPAPSVPAESSASPSAPSSPSKTIKLRPVDTKSPSPDPLLNSPPKKAAFDPRALRISLANGSPPIARPSLASPKAAYTVESLFKAAHEGHDMGRKAALLFEKFDADHNGILDLEELTALTKAMLENTLKTLIDANNEMVEKAIKERPDDEETIRSEAKIELDMIIPYAQSQIARSAQIAKEISDHMDADGNGEIDKEEFINQVTDCLKTYADFNVC